MDPLIGTIIMFAGNFAPRGWAFCQGQLLSIQQNTALFAIVGTSYGGNGQTTFALPDLRSRSPIGAGQGPGLSNIQLGDAAGMEQVTMTIANLPQHTHQAQLHAETAQADQVNPEGRMLGVAQPNGTLIYTDADSTTNNRIMNAASIVVQPTGNSMPVPIRNPYLGINYIIALEGVFPSRE